MFGTPADGDAGPLLLLTGVIILSGMLDIAIVPELRGSWLDELASAAPAPGGGAAAAVLAAIGAALVAMVCHLTIGKPRYAEHDELMRAALATAEELRARAVGLAGQDAVAFSEVSQAYKLPGHDKAAKAAAIQVALAGAAGVPMRTAALAAEVIGLAGRILGGANVNVISDVAVAASAARAALDAAAVNVEVNVAAMADESRQVALRAELAHHLRAGPVADSIVAAVRERISPAEADP